MHELREAVCDPEAFDPFRRLVSGQFGRADDLGKVEQFIRTVLLHDEMHIEIKLWPWSRTSGVVSEQVVELLRGYGADVRDGLVDWEIVGMKFNCADYPFLVPAESGGNPNVELTSTLLEF